MKYEVKILEAFLAGNNGGFVKIAIYNQLSDEFDTQEWVNNGDGWFVDFSHGPLGLYEILGEDDELTDETLWNFIDSGAKEITIEA